MNDEDVRDYIEEDESISYGQDKELLHASPKLQLTVGNYPNIITGARFQTTDFYNSAKNFQTGLTLTKYYSNSGECLSAVYRLLDDLNLGYVNYTGSSNVWPNLMFFLGKTIAQDFAPFQY
jgi:hypothetical protein